MNRQKPRRALDGHSDKKIIGDDGRFVKNK